jgi:hypothetical protein
VAILLCLTVERAVTSRAGARANQKLLRSAYLLHVLWKEYLGKVKSPNSSYLGFCMKHKGLVVEVGSSSMVALSEHLKDTNGSWDMGWRHGLRAPGRIWPSLV